MTDLLVKYRPAKFSDVIGQDVTVKSIQGAIKNKTGSSFLLTGPSGCGKTTIARIIATEFGCSDLGILEIDAATHTGIDDMREIGALTKFKGFGKNPQKAIIIDECHSLSRAAWQSLLKNIEEPPEHIYWILCTTEPSKVPNTIKTRCLTYDLKPVKLQVLDDFLCNVAEKEGFDLEKEENDLILGLIVRNSDGSPRKALSLFAQCQYCTTKDEAAALIAAADEQDEVINLCRLLAKGSTRWKDYMKILKDLQNYQAESIRIQIVNYFAKVLLNSKGSEKDFYYLGILDAFGTPYNQSDKFAPLLVSLGEVIYNGEE